jgi:hypothetical protein
MMGRTWAAAALLGLGLGLVGLARAAEAPPRRISRTALEDKVRGGWAGQMIGVAFGAPTEFHSNGKVLEGELAWAPESARNALQQDDLYVEMTLAEVVDRLGLDATTEQYADVFRDSRYRLWHANAGARRNLARGIQAPMSGHPDFNVHANDIDFQIESDFIGLMCPGLPQASNRFADRVGRVMNYGDGLYGGMFVAAMYAAAFFEAQPRRVVEQALLSIPAASGYAGIVRDVLAWHAEDPADWRRAWRLLQEKWDRGDPCPEGALAPFNIDARLNGAYVVLGLLYGGGDFARTLEVATRAGQDSDCNPSSAGGVLGVMLGYSRIPDAWRAGIPALAGEKFEFTGYSLDGIVASTVARAEKVVLAAGGRATPEGLLIPAQAPQAPPLEQWDPGVPVARVEADEAAWSWKGGWTSAPAAPAGQPPSRAKRAGGAGDEAVLEFEGTGVALVGAMAQDGGRADVWLDGAKAGEIEAWLPERTYDDDYWHATGLAPGRHTVRIVVRADRDPRSAGRRIEVRCAVVYAAR